MICQPGNRRRGHRRWFAQFGRPRHGSWDFALINQQPFSLMWYFILKLRKTSVDQNLESNVPQNDVLAINHSRQTSGFCVILRQKNCSIFFLSSSRWRWFAANMGGSSKRPWLNKKATLSRWWFQIFFIFTPKIGEDSQFDYYFQRGWNHQPVI